MCAGRHKNPSPLGDKKQQVFLLWNPSALVTERLHSFQCIVFPFFASLPEDTSQTSQNFVWTFSLQAAFQIESNFEIVGFPYGCCSFRSDYAQKSTPLISSLNCNIQRDTQEGHTTQILNHFLCVCLSEMMQLQNCLVVSIKIEIYAFVNISFVLGPL